MKIGERRDDIIALLTREKRAIRGCDLAEHYGVSRQIIVQDIAYLKKQGHEIYSTHTGYRIRSIPEMERIFKVKHTTEQTEDELTLFVNLGVTVEDVHVWHRVYGKLAAKLNIYTMEHVKQFMDGVRSGKSTELMHITSGYHYHTIRADSKEMLDAVEKALLEHGYIVPEV